MMLKPEDSVQREPTTLDKLSLSERRMMLPSTLSQELSPEVTRLSTSPQRSKDSSPKRESEERLSTRTPRRKDGNKVRSNKLLTKSSSPSTSRKRRLPRRPKVKPLQRLLPLSEFGDSEIYSYLHT